MRRLAALVFGLITYLSFLGVFVYAIGFVGNFGVPKSIDGVAVLPWPQAVLSNLLLLLLFGLQHSVMARPWFKSRWTRIVPEPVERSIYVLCSGVALAILYWQWQPIEIIVWHLEPTWARAICFGLFAIGWLTVLVSTFLINHFDLFGLRQVWLYFLDRPYKPIGFVTPGPYRVVRHPMYVGWLLAFWATPTMTVAHLAFAVTITVYILTAIYFEERDLIESLGSDYVNYRKTVPMFVPRWRNRIAMQVPFKTTTDGQSGSFESPTAALQHTAGIFSDTVNHGGMAK